LASRSYPDVSSAADFENPGRASKTNFPSPPRPSFALTHTFLPASRPLLISVASVRSTQCPNHKHHVFRISDRAAQEPHWLSREPNPRAREQVWQARYWLQVHRRWHAHDPHRSSWRWYVHRRDIPMAAMRLTSLPTRQGYSGPEDQGEVLRLSLGHRRYASRAGRC
jgi:hypothetical protein